MLFFQQPSIAVILPVASTVKSDSIIAADPTQSEGIGNEQALIIRGTSTSGEEVTIEMLITQKQSNYYGRFSHLGKPLQLIIRLTTTERTSAGRTQNATLKTVEELRLDELVEQVGGVENLGDLELAPIKGKNRWQFAHQEQPYPAMTIDLNMGRVVYDVIQP